MCLPWCCYPYTDVHLKDPPPKKDKEKNEEKRIYHMVNNRAPAIFYSNPGVQVAPINYASYGYPYPYYATAVPSPASAPAPAPDPKTKSPKPSDHLYWYGSTREEVDLQNRAVSATQAEATQMIPVKPSDYQYWCRELDGSYTLRTMTDVMENLQPGNWQYTSSGNPYWTRTAT